MKILNSIRKNLEITLFQWIQAFFTNLKIFTHWVFVGISEASIPLINTSSSIYWEYDKRGKLFNIILN